MTRHFQPISRKSSCRLDLRTSIRLGVTSHFTILKIEWWLARCFSLFWSKNKFENEYKINLRNFWIRNYCQYWSIEQLMLSRACRWDQAGGNCRPCHIGKVNFQCSDICWKSMDFVFVIVHSLFGFWIDSQPMKKLTMNHRCHLAVLFELTAEIPHQAHSEPSPPHCFQPT